MNLTRLAYRAVSTLALMSVLVGGCDPDSKEIGASAGETGGETGESMTGGTSGGESTSESESATSGATTDPPGTTDATETGATETGATETGETQDGTTTTAGLEECGDASTPEECELAGDGFTWCSWYDVDTYALDNEGVCGDLEIDQGRCFSDGWEDSGCFDYPPTCPDGNTRVFYSDVGLEVGAVEVVSYEFEDICEAPEGYMPCVYVDDGVTQTWDPPECACACPA